MTCITNTILVLMNLFSIYFHVIIYTKTKKYMLDSQSFEPVKINSFFSDPFEFANLEFHLVKTALCRQLVSLKNDKINVYSWSFMVQNVNTHRLKMALISCKGFM